MANKNPKYVGEEFVEEEEVVDGKGNEVEGLYDLVLPPGVPHKIILEVMDKFNLEVAARKCALKTIDVEPQNLLVLRGELDAVNKAHDFIYQKMSEKFNYKKPK